MKGAKIISRLKKPDMDGALSRTQMSVWTNEAKRRRPDLSTSERRGSNLDEGTTAIIGRKFTTNPHLSARKITQSLRIATSTICWDLIVVPGMRSRHFVGRAHPLMADQKVNCVKLMSSMVQVLIKREYANLISDDS
jgi:hypothetical protein